MVLQKQKPDHLHRAETDGKCKMRWKSKNQLRQEEVTKSLEAVKTEIEKTQKQMETLEGT